MYMHSSNRLNYSGSLNPVVNRLCEVFKVGKPITFSVIEVGYEDCNVFVEATNGKYVAKIFSKERNYDAILRYSTIMEKVVEAGVNHPILIKTFDDKFVYSDIEANGISMVLMNFIEGKTFLELNRAPDNEERKRIIEQAAKVNKINYNPPYLFDSWAIPNIKIIFEKVKNYSAQKISNLLSR
jgi:hypothetical protein